MKAQPFLVTLAAALVWAPLALANPIASEVLRVRQVPLTQHVQVTWARYDGEVAPADEVRRDGTVIDVDWQEMSGSFTANTGSGLTGLDAAQFCDCDVPLGDHEYEMLAAGSGYSYEMTASLTVVENLQPPDDTGGGDSGHDAGGTDEPDMMPWDIPEPTEIQGLDCTAACDGEPSFPSVGDASPTDDARTDGAAPSVSGPTQEEDEGGGCSVAPRDASFPLAAWLLGFGLWVLDRRRPRAR